MRKIFMILAVLVIALAVLLPTAVAASDDFCSPMYCRCCYDHVKLYRVSYFDSNHDWVSVLVEVSYQEARVAGMSTGDFAADTLGLAAGYNCWVGRVILPPD